MKPQIMHILTRTPLHVGAGSSVGAIDMPVQRERHTQIPIIPGSALKGVFRDMWNGKPEDQEKLFGSDNKERDEKNAKAGDLTIGEARVLCFPVRSARNSFAWVTSPLALARYVRETSRALVIPEVAEDQCLASEQVCLKNPKDKVVLEEYGFKRNGDVPEDIRELLIKAFETDPVWQTATERLVILSDTMFSHFCANACEIQQRIRINDETGTVDNRALFNQENVPSETLFYGSIGARRDEQTISTLSARLDELRNTVQIGGDETIGLGYCTVKIAQE